uniref:hypothetical protein n=1 Tax=Acidovorax sp. SUPP3334 TaxID=2920881 RepID=UPI0029529555|nr:hypothetical protein [Acidovorax sp. SUPP3334]BDH38342.1 plasmid mobilization relaxosome protein MobC [Acidovorax sp. SUPP3334]
MSNESVSSSSRAAGLVTVDFGPALKTQWLTWCADRNLRPAKALRSLIERVIAEGLELAPRASDEPVQARVASEPDRGPKIGREVYLTPSENAAVEAVAESQGFGVHEWVVGAIRAGVAGAPSYGQEELQALTQSNALLAQLVVDLSALRKRQDDDQLAAALAQVEGAVRHHVETVSAVMAQGARRWQLTV